MGAQSLWERYQAHLVRYHGLGIWLDISRMRFSDTFFDVMTPKADEAFSRMKELEAGAIAMAGKVHGALEAAKGSARTVEQLAADTDSEDSYHVLNHLTAKASNKERMEADEPSHETFRLR